MSNIIPKYVEVHPRFDSEFIYLGRWNLYYLLKYWEEIRDNDIAIIKRLKRILAEADKTGTTEKIMKSTDSIKRELRSVKGHRDNAMKNIERLAKLMVRAKVKPPFAIWRSIDHFLVGEDITFFDGQEFIPAKVVDRTNDTTIVLRTKQSPEQHYIYERNPVLLNKKEFKYLKNHSNYRKLWIRASNASPKMNSAFDTTTIN